MALLKAALWVGQKQSALVSGNMEAFHINKDSLDISFELVLSSPDIYALTYLIFKNFCYCLRAIASEAQGSVFW